MPSKVWSVQDLRLNKHRDIQIHTWTWVVTCYFIGFISCFQMRTSLLQNYFSWIVLLQATECKHAKFLTPDAACRDTCPQGAVGSTFQGLASESSLYIYIFIDICSLIHGFMHPPDPGTAFLLCCRRSQSIAGKDCLYLPALSLLTAFQGSQVTS